MPLPRQLSVYACRGHTVVEFRGDIDIVAATELGPFLDRVTGRDGLRLVVDLRPVEFFDASGLRLLHRARTRVMERGGQLRLVCTHPLTLRILRVTGLARALPAYPSLDAALARFEAASGPL
ncbi:anti-sigma factor antagonist [Streptomyces sp. NPDC006193]|uniref:anti-sigma factor antagonist n=1 Tax=Streptomyces sp. NPDC006193 TaxID=3155717 RepID=UPI0033AEDFA1